MMTGSPLDKDGSAEGVCLSATGRGRNVQSG